ncbi:MAG: prolyl aminopeptidase [Pseudomonadota bacterium]
MAMLYPPIEPYADGMLDVGDGNAIAWEMSGNPDGKPALVLHGGPGSGRSTSTRRFFDPDVYNIILFDQRGCGESTPHASDPDCDMTVNTTAHLIADMENLRAYVGVDRWLVFGHSWGCTLALAYAEEHPEEVAALVLVGVTTCRQSEIDWLYRGIAPLFPEAWERFRAGVSKAERNGDLVAAYHRRLNDPDEAVCHKAASDWHDWEGSLSADPGAALSEAWADPRFRLARARIITHYFHHAAWLSKNQILCGAHALAGIPGVMVQGRLDLEAPLMTAWDLAKVWPSGDLVIVPNAGHGVSEAGMGEAITAATDRFAADQGIWS